MRPIHKSHIDNDILRNFISYFSLHCDKNTSEKWLLGEKSYLAQFQGILAHPDGKAWRALWWPYKW